MRKTLVLSALLIAAAVGCQGDGQVDPTDREISDAELAAMVLPQEDLGLDYADLTPDEDDSGLQSNEEMIDSDFDEEDAAQDIDRFGRLTGYADGYYSLEAIMEVEGAFGIGTAVDLYQGADGASGDLKDDIQDAQRQVGMSSEGATLEDAEVFDPGAVGDESAGLLTTVSMPAAQEARMYITTVQFRRGRLLGSVAIGSFDEHDVREEAAALARKLDQRILAVLEGEITARPAVPPESTRTPSTSAFPPDVLDSFRYYWEVSVEADGEFAVASEGEFEAPDRLRCLIITSLGDLAEFEENLVVIGDDAWMHTGEEFQATGPDDAEILDNLDLCPGSPVFWEGFALSDLTPLVGEPEMVNDVAAVRYRLDEAADNLRRIGFLPPEAEGMTVNAFDVWLAEDGGWPVAVDFDVLANAEVAAESFALPIADSGQELRLRMRLDITDTNSPDIHVEPPIE